MPRTKLPTPEEMTDFLDDTQALSQELGHSFRTSPIQPDEQASGIDCPELEALS